MLLADLPPDLPLLLFATAEAPAAELPADALALFGRGDDVNAVELQAPSATERRAMFESLATEAAGSASERPTPKAQEPPPQVRRLLRLYLSYDLDSSTQNDIRARSTSRVCAVAVAARG